MEDLERRLSSMTLAPYIVKAMALIGVRRRAGSNMFRHQISTMGILLDYKFIDPVLLKASLIHDLFEDALGMPGVSREEIVRIDADGPAVYDLVMEMTIRIVDGRKELKSEYLTRIMKTGSSGGPYSQTCGSNQQPRVLGVRARREIRDKVPHRDPGVYSSLRGTNQPGHVP